ncbi:MAG: phage antirepressor KilAC domain-containing protein [Acidaminococcus intestini]|jgi:anti-repressor protein|uniref:phage antirepressor n=1 Tax=Acidaminococcus TaxID=904 RepID=UPI00242A41A6|nr:MULTISPECIES: phage antirepressor [Acidaminococcus]MBS6986058.1 phage antirepressor KilAC domain-containing protein [Acidaminococcus intestini]MDY2739742.1 phage antirepressor [Acidaminococcus sp.]
MKKLEIFQNKSFGRIRTLAINNEPWFVGKDVAEILGYAKPENAIANHVDEEDKTSTLIQGSGSNYKSKAIIINESGLYSLVLSSKLPSAKEFKRWITHEVIPAIRKHGAYMTEDTLEKALTSPDFLIQLATQLKEEKEKRLAAEKQIEMDRPKTIFADAVSASHTSILVGEMAKILRGNGVEIGQKRFFDWLRENGYLIRRKGTDYNMPTQRAMELGLFEIKEGSYVNGSGVNIITKTPKITGKGQQYFVNKFLTDTRR